MNKTCAVGTLGLTLAFALACGGTTTVEGDRAGLLGGCPEGEVCAATVPGGLFFQGQMLYDDGAQRLGPVLVGGSFDLSFFPVGGVMVDFETDIDSDSMEAGYSELGLGRPSLVELWGLAPGMSTVRIVHAETGELLNRLTIETVELEDVELTNVNEPERLPLIEGCDEMIGVRLVAGGGRLRAFDQSVEVRAPGQITPDPGVWDCFQYTVPFGVEQVDFEITAGGLVWVRSFEVVPADGTLVCPQTTTD